MRQVHVDPSSDQPTIRIECECGSGVSEGTLVSGEHELFLQCECGKRRRVARKGDGFVVHEVGESKK